MRGGTKVKRITAILISLVFLLTLCACQNDDKDNKQTLDFDTATIEIGETHTDFEGVNIKIKNAVWDENDIKLEINWINKTRYEVTYGSSYAIELKKDDEWISRQKIDNLVFNSIGYLLKAGKTEEKTYNLTDTFDITEKGTYRLITDCSVFDKGKGGESTKCTLWAEFSVTRKGGEDGSLAKEKIDFEVQYIRTNSKKDISNYPLFTVLQSVNELNAYYESNKDSFNLERRNNPTSDSTIGFLDACDKYDEEFFSDNALVFIVVQEGSGSTRHNVNHVKVDSDGKFYVDISSIVPETDTCDMAQWHIIIEIEKEHRPTSYDDIAIYIDDKLITDNLWHNNQPIEEGQSISEYNPNYSFSLTWGTYGYSSYDSETGELIKSKDATNPKDYTTNLKLTEHQYSAIWKLIESLDIESYPDKYNPHKNGVSIPYMKLILSVKSDDIDKTVTVEETILSYDANNKKGQKFLDVCKGIEEILTETSEWKSLPEYEFLYD